MSGRLQLPTEGRVKCPGETLSFPTREPAAGNRQAEQPESRPEPPSLSYSSEETPLSLLHGSSICSSEQLHTGSPQTLLQHKESESPTAGNNQSHTEQPHP